MTEEEVKLNYITPAIENAGWAKKQIRMEYSINAGKIVVRGNVAKRLPKKKADYVLFYKENLPLAVVEAKDNNHNIGDGMFQAQEYAGKLDVRFVFTSNGDGFLSYDMKTGEQKLISLDEFPSPQELFDKQYKEEVEKSDNYKKILETIKKEFADVNKENLGVGSTIYAVKPGDGSAREQAASCQKVLGGWANIAQEYATKRYRSNLINWGMLPFIYEEEELPFKKDDFIFVPNIAEAVKNKTTEIPAYVVGDELKPFTLKLGEMTDDERDIILKGCLINYNRV